MRIGGRRRWHTSAARNTVESFAAPRVAVAPLEQESFPLRDHLSDSEATLQLADAFAQDLREEFEQRRCPRREHSLVNDAERTRPVAR